MSWCWADGQRCQDGENHRSCDHPGEQAVHLLDGGMPGGDVDESLRIALRPIRAPEATPRQTDPGTRQNDPDQGSPSEQRDPPEGLLGKGSGHRNRVGPPAQSSPSETDWRPQNPM